jgi:hypothetical protein
VRIQGVDDELQQLGYFRLELLLCHDTIVPPREYNKRYLVLP